jgi:hypothetical protein
MELKKLISAVTLALGVMAAMPAVANTYTEDNVTFNIFDSGASTFSVEITNALNGTGGWADATQISAIAFNNLGVDLSTVAYVSGPKGADWLVQAGGISTAAGGCNGTGNFVCFGGSAIDLTNDMLWKFSYTAGTLNLGLPDGDTGLYGPHLKLVFLNDEGTKVGTLLSTTIPAVPEPETYAMMLAGLGLMGFVARRRRAN